MKLVDEVFEDESIGIEGELSTANSNQHPGGIHQYRGYGSTSSQPRGSDSLQQYGGYAIKPALPRGSDAFQKVLLEIKKEKEDAENGNVDKLGQLKSIGKTGTSESQKQAKGSMWKMASMKFFKRTKSQRELLKK